MATKEIVTVHKGEDSYFFQFAGDNSMCVVPASAVSNLLPRQPLEYPEGDKKLKKVRAPRTVDIDDEALTSLEPYDFMQATRFPGEFSI